MFLAPASTHRVGNVGVSERHLSRGNHVQRSAAADRPQGGRRGSCIPCRVGGCEARSQKEGCSLPAAAYGACDRPHGYVRCPGLHPLSHYPTVAPRLHAAFSTPLEFFNNRWVMSACILSVDCSWFAGMAVEAVWYAGEKDPRVQEAATQRAGHHPPICAHQGSQCCRTQQARASRGGDRRQGGPWLRHGEAHHQAGVRSGGQGQRRP